MQDAVDQRVAACLAALLLPIRHIEVPLKKGKTELLVAYVTAKSIKCCKADTNAIVSLHHELPELSMIHSKVQGTPSARSSNRGCSGYMPVGYSRLFRSHSC
jgi:hypothetical protein